MNQLEVESYLTLKTGEHVDKTGMLSNRYDLEHVFFNLQTIQTIFPQ